MRLATRAAPMVLSRPGRSRPAARTGEVSGGGIVASIVGATAAGGLAGFVVGRFYHLGPIGTAGGLLAGMFVGYVGLGLYEIVHPAQSSYSGSGAGVPPVTAAISFPTALPAGAAVATLAPLRVLGRRVAGRRAPPLVVAHRPGTNPWRHVPNAITIGGYASTLAWIAGAHPAYAVVGLVADEVDGRLARATESTSELGGLLDWAVDLTVTGLVALRLGWPWLLLAITPAQAWLRAKGVRPNVGSARAALTVLALVKGA